MPWVLLMLKPGRAARSSEMASSGCPVSRGGGERPTEEALRARAADFSPAKAADAYVALFEELVRGRG